MELKRETEHTISSVLNTRLFEIWSFNKIAKKNLLSKVPTEQDLDNYVDSIIHYFDIRHAYIEFCNEADIEVDLSFEYPEVDEDKFYREHCPDEVEEASFQEDEDED